jgi:hypothetical protein
MVEIDLEYLHLFVLWAELINSAPEPLQIKNLESIIEQTDQICYIVLRFHALFSLNFYNPITEVFNFCSYVCLFCFL